MEPIHTAAMLIVTHEMRFVREGSHVLDGITTDAVLPCGGLGYACFSFVLRAFGQLLEATK